MGNSPKRCRHESEWRLRRGPGDSQPERRARRIHRCYRAEEQRRRNRGVPGEQPNAEFIRAQVGAFATSGRNILATPRIDNVVFGIAQNIRITERYRVQLRADMFNALNHPQYTLGEINNVSGRGTFTGFSANPFILGNPAFARWDRQFSSNPRTLTVSAKVSF
jgi:hypothetical protein